MGTLHDADCRQCLAAAKPGAIMPAPIEARRIGHRAETSSARPAICRRVTLHERMEWAEAPTSYPMTQTPSEDDRSLGSRVLGLWVAYVKGQLLISLLIGALTWIVSAGIGLSGAAVLGALAGVLESIPNLGPLIALVPAVAMALWKGSSVIPVSNWVFALIVVGAYLAVQQIGNLFLQPRILSEQLRLPPLVVFLALIVGAAVAGVLGAYLAVPVLATLREFGVYWRQRRSV